MGRLGQEEGEREGRKPSQALMTAGPRASDLPATSVLLPLALGTAPPDSSVPGRWHTRQMAGTTWHLSASKLSARETQKPGTCVVVLVTRDTHEDPHTQGEGRHPELKTWRGVGRSGGRVDRGLEGPLGPGRAQLGTGEHQRPHGDRRDCLPGSPLGHPPKQSTPKGPTHGTAPAKPSTSITLKRTRKSQNSPHRRRGTRCPPSGKNRK